MLPVLKYSTCTSSNTTYTNVLFDCAQVLFTSNNKFIVIIAGGTQWSSLLRQFATTRQVTVSFPDDVNGIFHWHNPSAGTIALRLTQPLTEISIWWVEAVGEYG